jgi:phage terminase large subunit-like protein
MSTARKTVKRKAPKRKKAAKKKHDYKHGPKKGVPYKSIEQHKLEGTYRPDRHGKGIEKTPLKLQKPVITQLPSKKESRKWIRTPADERALANGCRFSVELAEYVVEWFRTYLRHSEGRWAGQPFELMGWERDDVVMPLFGWVRKSEEFNRLVRRIRVVYIEVPKKSGKSPFGAGIGTHMMAGDGEEGAKVISVATDKDQAAIAHTHAMNMVEDSPELFERCKIQRSTRGIRYIPTRSAYVVVSSEYRGREGLNLNCAIKDEVHAWYGDQLYQALRYAMASRIEPIDFQITTAGDDMASVCRRQHDYAVGVNKADDAIHDDTYLGVIYAADRDDDWTDPKVWAKANPSLGVTVVKSELAAMANAAKRDPREISAFKRYRLNIWATATYAWLDMAKWEACGADYTAEDLEGELCYAALDLSRIHDFTALMLIFPMDDGSFRQLPFFWLPEATIEDRAHLAPYRQWAADGYLEPVEGEQINQTWLCEQILAIFERFDVQELVYDPQYAEKITADIEAACDVERVKFDQNMPQYAEPTDEYERLIVAGELEHPNHPVLTWQAGHCNVKQDSANRRRPLKPKRGDYRTIDAIVAGVMALSRAMVGEGEEVEDHEVIVV